MSKPRSQDVLETIKNAIATALQSAVTTGTLSSLPAQVVPGWPVSTQLTNILAQGQYQVSVYMLPGGKNITESYPETFAYPNQASSLIAAISGGVITFSGIVVPGLNVHAFVGASASLKDAYFKTITGNDLPAVATGVKNAINALSAPGISATSSGPATTVSGSIYLACNIGLSAVSMATEASKMQKSVQVSVWTPNPILRMQVMDPIIQQVGTTLNQSLTLSDGMQMRIVNSGRENWNNDKLQSSYSCYEYHVIFDVEFFNTTPITGAQIESVEEDFAINSASADTLISDGLIAY